MCYKINLKGTGRNQSPWYLLSLWKCWKKRLKQEELRRNCNVIFICYNFFLLCLLSSGYSASEYYQTMSPPTQNTEKEERECWGGWEEGGRANNIHVGKEKKIIIYTCIYINTVFKTVCRDFTEYSWYIRQSKL